MLQNLDVHITQHTLHLRNAKIKPVVNMTWFMLEAGTWTGQDISLGPFLKFKRQPNLALAGLESSTPSLCDAFEVLPWLWRLRQRQMPSPGSWKTPRVVECRASHCPACWNAIKALKHTRAPATRDGKWKPPTMPKYNISRGKTKWSNKFGKQKEKSRVKSKRMEMKDDWHAENVECLCSEGRA